MAFVLRRPFSLAPVLFPTPRVAPRSLTSSWASTRAFHQQPSRPGALLAKIRNGGSQPFRRSYMQETYQVPQPKAGNRTQRLLYGAGLVGATILATNLIFNRETREDGGMPIYERQYLNDTFLHTGLGLGVIAVAARGLHMNGWSYRLMMTNPWVVVGVSLVASIGTMMGTYATSPDNYIQKYALWTAFNVSQAAILSPLLFLQPALLARAGLYTVGVMGSLAFVGATAKQEKYLYIGGPLLAGVAVVALSGLAPLVIPATAVRTLMWTENLWLYGGLAVFGGFTLYDVQKVLHHARQAQFGAGRLDPVNESIRLELDFLNIWIRMVQILGMRSNKRK